MLTERWRPLDLRRRGELGPYDGELIVLHMVPKTSSRSERYMLTPRELYMANGFPRDYKIERDYTGKEYPKTKQVARCGNAVPPPFATALVRANLPEWCGAEFNTMKELEEVVAV